MTERLVLFVPFVRGAEDEAEREAALAQIRAERARYGERGFLEDLARRINPQWADDAEYLEWFVWHHRLTATPASWAEFRRMQVDLDVGDVLPTIRVPTLVLSKEFVREDAEEVARAIPDAEHVVLPGIGNAIFENDFALRGDRGVPRGDRAAAGARSPCSRRSSSPTSSGRRSARPSSATTAGASCSRSTARSSGTSWRGSAAPSSTPPATASSPRSTARPARSRARAPSSTAPRTLGLDVRAGIHTGECERSDGKLAGLAVHVGARVLAAAGAGEVVVSGTVRDLVAGSGFAFDDLGERELKGVPGSWRLLRVVASNP